MAGGDIKILDKLSINQNLVILITSYIGVVHIARINVDNQYLYCIISFVGCLCSILFFICVISVISSMIVYTTEYCVKKWYKQKSQKLLFLYRRKMVGKYMDSREKYSIDLIKMKDIF